MVTLAGRSLGSRDLGFLLLMVLWLVSASTHDDVSALPEDWDQEMEEGATRHAPDTLPHPPNTSISTDGHVVSQRLQVHDELHMSRVWTLAYLDTSYGLNPAVSGVAKLSDDRQRGPVNTTRAGAGGVPNWGRSPTLLAWLTSAPRGRGYRHLQHWPAFGREWNYARLGPVTWGARFKACSGRHQSPVDLTSNLCHFRPMSMTLTRTLLPERADFRLQYDGAAVSLVPAGTIEVKGEALGHRGQRYQLSELHFHWSSRSGRGSEHAVNGRRFPLELHLFLCNSRYAGKAEAVDQQDGFTALAVFFTIGAPNAGMEQILSGERVLKQMGEGTRVKLSGVKTTSLLPKDTTRFFRYNGSMTTPPCSQNVLWTVFEDVQTLSEHQFHQFQAIRLSREESRRHLINMDNVRPLQPLYGRSLFTSNPNF